MLCSSLSHVWLFGTPWTVARQAPLSMGSIQARIVEGLPFPPPGDLPYCLSQQGNPRILEWVACPFSRGNFWAGNRTGVSCIAGRFFTSWATQEAHFHIIGSSNYRVVIILSISIIITSICAFWLPCWLSSKESACQCRRWRLDPWVWKIPWQRAWQPTPVFLPRESHGQRRLTV